LPFLASISYGLDGRRSDADDDELLALLTGNVDDIF
jgi:hypothetical protein